MNCWACGRPAAGFGHLDLRFPASDARRYRHRWAFCSRHCQDAFHQLYDARAWNDPASIEDLLPMSLPLSQVTQRACLQALGAAAERVGFDTPLSRYSQVQATELIEAVIHAYETCLQADAGARGFMSRPFVDDSEIPF